jgi:hypothetical protein
MVAGTYCAPGVILAFIAVKILSRKVRKGHTHHISSHAKATILLFNLYWLYTIVKSDYTLNQ